MKKKILIIFLLIINLVIWSNVFSPSPRILKVTFLDVGQGDAIFIQFPYGGNMLIDGGLRRKEYDVGERVISPFLRKQGLRRVNTVVATHPHLDHIGGLISILKNFKVNLVLDSGLSHTSYTYFNFLKIIKKNKIPYKIGRRGQRIKGYKGVDIYILHPPESLIKEANLDLNNNCLVIKIIYKNISFLFTADIEKEGESDLLKLNKMLESTILKVPHHGSKSSSSLIFLKLIKPMIAVISVGRKNRFHHPHKVTLDKLRGLGAKIYRTDKNGAIIIKTDGENIEIKTMRKS